MRSHVPSRGFGFVLVLLLGLTPACRSQPASQPAPLPLNVAADTTFARLVDQLSEPGGFFDTDNLISNERSYLHVLGELDRLGVRGGAYIGVGPDQNFSYMARIRPEVAFIIDIRRDNLLQHVFFKALFTLAETRLDYLCLLFGRPGPEDPKAWQHRPLADLLAYIDTTEATATDQTQRRVEAASQQAGLPLSAEDLATIRRIHSRFIESGLALQFNSHGRAPMPYYPTYGQLLMETDRDGQPASFLVREEDFQFLKHLQARNRVVPVVGDLAGPHALAAIGDYLSAHRLPVTAFYTSNIEYYLMREGRFAAFADNARRLPLTERSVIIRSYFNRWRTTHPQSLPGYASTQLLQPISPMLDAYSTSTIRSYNDLVHY